MEARDPDFERRAEERRRRTTVRVFHSWAEAAAAEDAHWDAISPEERMALTWEMALEYLEWTGRLESESRLQRAVLHVQRP